MKKVLFIVATIAVIIGAFFVFKSHPIEITGEAEMAKVAKKSFTSKPTIGSLSGIECANGTSRPIAVMYPSDPETRPLAGIGQADMVFEMPVTENGVTRMMAVFQCNHPKEIGSIRSARMDFIPFVLGLDAIYVHWGGEHDALAELNKGIADNIDCLKLDGTTCLRKKSIPMPHNGYTTSDLVLKKAKALGYELTGSVRYNHAQGMSQGMMAPPVLYSDTNWSYNAQANRYARTRSGKPEIDRGTGRQVTASNIAVLHTTSVYVSILYNRVKTVGSGKIELYQNGTVIQGTWEKATDKSKLLLLDKNGDEISLVSGSTWVEIVTQ